MKRGLEKIIKRSWSLSSTRRMSYLRLRMYQYGQFAGYRDVFGRAQKYYLARYKNGVACSYLDEIETKSQMEFIKNKFLSKSFDLQKFAERMKSDFDSSLNRIKCFAQDYSKKNVETIVSYLNKFYLIDNGMSIYYWILFNDIEKMLIDSLSQLMQKSGKVQSEIQRDLSVLAQPTLIIPIDLERISILKLALKKQEELSDGLAKHTKEFAFLPMYDIDYKEYSSSHFKSELKKIFKNPPEKIRKEIRLIEKKYIDRKLKSETVLKKYKDHKKIFSLAKFIMTFANYKDRKPYIRDQISYWGRCLFLEIAKRLNLSLTQALFLTDAECIGMLKGKIKISKNQLNRRINNSAVLFFGLQQMIFTDQKDLKIIEHIIDNSKNQESISGFSACPGKAKGRVCIILSSDDIPKFKKGQILISSATRPDFLPIMKKAAAIITNEGGMLSHAAIVARELKKPCIIGTKIATKVLKDGDLVEVDANKGIVKILK